MSSSRSSSCCGWELPSRPRTSHDFRPASSKSNQPPKRSATPAISSSSHSSLHRRSHKKDKGYSGRGKKKEKNRALPALDEEEEDEGGVSLEPEQRFRYGRTGDPSIFDDGRFRQGTIIPDVLNPTKTQFSEDESLSFWSWNEQRNNWYHFDAQTGETLWAPAHFA
jgi:hypothetical protein